MIRDHEFQASPDPRARGCVRCGRLFAEHWWATVWLTCSMCGDRFQVDRNWWCGRVSAGYKVGQCKHCHAGAHIDAPILSD